VDPTESSATPPPSNGTSSSGGSAPAAMGGTLPGGTGVVTPAAGPPPTGVLPPGVRAGMVRKRYTGRRIDLDFKGADIHNILRLLSDVGQVNIVTSDDVKGEVTKDEERPLGP